MRSTARPQQAYVFTPDHRSHIDITALMGALPRVHFAAKRELFDEPVLGAAMRALGMIPIDRDHPALARRALDEAAAKAGKRVSVVIFPEGTRAPAGQMLPFKGGAFVFAIQEQVPVVLVALHNHSCIAGITILCCANARRSSIMRRAQPRATAGRLVKKKP